MRTPSVLVTGASGEIGHGLINQLSRTGRSIVTVDIAPLEPAMARQVRREFTGWGFVERAVEIVPRREGPFRKHRSWYRRHDSPARAENQPNTCEGLLKAGKTLEADIGCVMCRRQLVPGRAQEVLPVLEAAGRIGPASVATCPSLRSDPPCASPATV